MQQSLRCREGSIEKKLLVLMFLVVCIISDSITCHVENYLLIILWCIIRTTWVMRKIWFRDTNYSWFIQNLNSSQFGPQNILPPLYQQSWGCPGNCRSAWRGLTDQYLLYNTTKMLDSFFILIPFWLLQRPWEMCYCNRLKVQREISMSCILLCRH